MMIGAADADNNIAELSQHPACVKARGKNQGANEFVCVEAAAGGVNTLSTFPAAYSTDATLSADNVDYDSAAMENHGSAIAGKYYMGTAETVDFNAIGKICLIDRGEITFQEKVINCEASGGLGAVIINNVSGMLYGTLGDNNATSIPTVGAALEDREALLAALAVSVDVNTSDYGVLSGTSMATPTVAGVAALVWSNHPECTGEQIRSAIKASAEDQGDVGHDVYFGYGLVKAKAANDYLATHGCAGQ